MTKRDNHHNCAYKARNGAIPCEESIAIAHFNYRPDLLHLVENITRMLLKVNRHRLNQPMKLILLRICLACAQENTAILSIFRLMASIFAFVLLAILKSLPDRYWLKAPKSYRQ